MAADSMIMQGSLPDVTGKTLSQQAMQRWLQEIQNSTSSTGLPNVLPEYDYASQANDVLSQLANLQQQGADTYQQSINNQTSRYNKALQNQWKRLQEALSNG